MGSKKLAIKVMAITLSLAVVLGLTITLARFSFAEDIWEPYDDTLSQGEEDVGEVEIYNSADKETDGGIDFDTEDDGQGEEVSTKEEAAEDKAEKTSSSDTTKTTKKTAEGSSSKKIVRLSEGYSRKTRGSSQTIDLGTLDKDTKTVFDSVGVTTYVFVNGSKAVGFKSDIINIPKEFDGTIIMENNDISTLCPDDTTFKPGQEKAEDRYARNVPIKIEAGAKVHLKLIGTNNVQSGTDGGANNKYSHAAAIEVAPGATLRISDGSGTNSGILNAKASNDPTIEINPTIDEGGGGAGIGGSEGTNVGTIIIDSGTINATGGYHGAGIGSGWHATYIPISDTATSVLSGPGYDGDIIIYGTAKVVSTGGYHGNGMGGSCNSIGKGALIVIPGAEVTVKTHYDDSYAVIKDKNLYNNWAGLGSMGKFFYLGKYESTSPTTIAIPQIDPQGTTRGYKYKYTINPAKIQIEKPASGNLPEDYYLQLDLTNLAPADQWVTTKLQGVGITDMILDFGVADKTNGSVETSAYLTAEGSISVDLSKAANLPAGFDPSKGDKLFLDSTIGKSHTDIPPLEAEYNSSVNLTLKKYINTAPALLVSPQFKFTAAQTPTTAKDIMYSFTEAEAKAEGFLFNILNKEHMKSVTSNGVTKDVDVSGMIRDIITSLQKTSSSFALYDNTVPSILFSKDDGDLKVFLNPKNASGDYTIPGTYTDNLLAEGYRVETSDELSKVISQKVLKGKYIDEDIDIDPGDDGSFIEVPKQRLDEMIEVTAVKPGLPAGEKVNIATNKVKLKYKVLDRQLRDVKVYYHLAKKVGGVFPETPASTDTAAWTSFSDGSQNQDIIFPADGEYIIYYKTNSNHYSSLGGFIYYNVDITRPTVTEIKQMPRPNNIVGIIKNDPETIDITFDSDFDIMTLKNSEIKGEGVKILSVNHKSGTTFEVKIEIDKAVTNVGDYVKIYVEDSAGTDKHGNPSTASEYFNLFYILESPYSRFIDAKEKDIIDGTKMKQKVDFINIDIYAKDDHKRGQLFSDTTGAALIDASNANSHYGTIYKVVDKNGALVPATVTYTPITGTGTEVLGGRFKVTFTNPIEDDGIYKIILDEKKVYNAHGIVVPKREASFEMIIPEIDATNPPTIDIIKHPEQGGTSIITIKGKNLDSAQSIIIKDKLGNIADIVVIATNPNEIKVEVKFPPNTSYDVHENYQLEVIMNDGTTTHKFDLTYKTQKDPIIEVSRKKSVLELDAKGGTPQVKPIEQDKDFNGGIFDITDYDYKGKNQPVKPNHLFLGWYYGKNRVVDKKFDLNMPSLGGKGGHYKIVAGWLDLTDMGGSEFVDYKEPKEDTIKYVGESTKEEIEKEFAGDITITLPDGTVVKPEIKYEWSHENVNESGVITITVLIENPTNPGEFIEQKRKIYVFILNRAYISSKDLVMFEFGQNVSSNGNEWSPIVVEELADTVNKRIVTKAHTPTFGKGDFDPYTPGTYTVAFSATIINYRGETEVVPTKQARAIVMPKDDAQIAAHQANIAAQRFWVCSSEMLHLSVPGESWSIDKTNYLEYGEKVGKVDPKGKSYDTLINVRADGFPLMSAEILQVLSEQPNTLLVIHYGELKWEFHSKDFKDLYKSRETEPTSYFNLGYKMANENEAINKLVGKRVQQQVLFEMDRHYIGSGTITIKLNKDLKNATNLNLFNYNADAKQMELIGKMTKNSDGTASIKLKEVRGSYVILSGLSNDNKASSSADKTASFKKLAYKITDKTNTLSKAYKTEVEKDLKTSGKNIKSITISEADASTLSRIEAAQGYKVDEIDITKNKNLEISDTKIFIIISLGVMLLLVGGSIFFLGITNKKKEKNANMEKFTIE